MSAKDVVKDSVFRWQGEGRQAEDRNLTFSCLSLFSFLWMARWHCHYTCHFQVVLRHGNSVRLNIS